MRLTTDTTIPQFNDVLAEFIKAKRLTIPRALRTQGRFLGKRLVDFTPPKTRAQGRDAVKRDVHRAARPLKPSQFKSREIRAAIRKRDYAALQVIFDRITHGDIANARVKEFTPALHGEARDRRGRVTRWRKVVTPDEDEVRAYVQRVQKRVGEAKGGWAELVLRLGGSVSGWIAAHKGAGRFEDRADHPINTYIRIDNQSAWAEGGDEDRIVANAIRSRTAAIRQSIVKAQQDAKRKAKLK